MTVRQSRLREASYHHPLQPHGVLMVTKRPPETASIGEMAARNSSSIREASSAMSKATFDQPLVVFSSPGRLTIREPDSRVSDNAFFCLRGHRPAQCPIQREGTAKQLPATGAATARP